MGDITDNVLAYQAETKIQATKSFIKCVPGL